MPIARLAAVPWAACQPGTGHREMHLRVCRRLGGFEPDLRYSSDDFLILLELVRTTGAGALLPDLVLGYGAPGVAVRAGRGRDRTRGLPADAAQPHPGGGRGRDSAQGRRVLGRSDLRWCNFGLPACRRLTRPAARLRNSSACSTRARPCGRSAAPLGVRVTERRSRSNKRTFGSRLSALICRESDGPAMRKRSAARPKFSSSPTVTSAAGAAAPGKRSAVRAAAYLQRATRS